MQTEFDYFDFSNVKFKEKEEKDLCIINPKLHGIDRDIIDRVFKSITNKVDDFKVLCPKHFVYDLYSLYYNRTGETTWDTSFQYNDTKQKLLKKFNKEKYKIISNTSGVNSFFFLRYLLQIINDFYRDEVPEEVRKKIIQDLKNHKPQTQTKKNTQQQNTAQQPQQDGMPTDEGLPKDGEVQGDPNNTEAGSGHGNDNSFDSAEQTLENVSKSKGGDSSEGIPEEEPKLTEEQVDEKFEEFLEDDAVSDKIDEKIEELFDDIATLKDNLLDTDDLQDERFEDILDNIGKIDQIKEELSKIKFNKHSLQPLIRQVLNESRNYFSSRTKPRDVPIMESDSLSNINNIEYLHPILRKIKLLDITTIEREPIGKLDVYFDVSGSMSSRAFDEVSALTLTKAILLNMMNLGIVEDVYPFESHICPKLGNEISVLLTRTRGGTSLTTVVNTIKEKGRNAVIITDAQDTVYENNYSEKAFFIGINTTFAGIRDDQYRKNNQLIHYDPTKGTFEYCKELKKHTSYGY